MNEIKFKDAPPIRSGEDISNHPAMKEAVQAVSEDVGLPVTDFHLSIPNGKVAETTVAEFSKFITEAMRKSVPVTKEDLANEHK